MAFRYNGLQTDWDPEIYESVRAKCDIIKRYIKKIDIKDNRKQFKKDYPNWKNWYTNDRFFVKDTIDKYNDKKPITPTAKDKSANYGEVIRAARIGNNSIAASERAAVHYRSVALSSEARRKYASRQCRRIGTDTSNINDEECDDDIKTGWNNNHNSNNNNNQLNEYELDLSDDSGDKYNLMCDQCDTAMSSAYWPVRCYGDSCNFYAHYTF